MSPSKFALFLHESMFGLCIFRSIFNIYNANDHWMSSKCLSSLQSTVSLDTKSVAYSIPNRFVQRQFPIKLINWPQIDVIQSIYENDCAQAFPYFAKLAIKRFNNSVIAHILHINRRCNLHVAISPGFYGVHDI